MRVSFFVLHSLLFLSLYSCNTVESENNTEDEIVNSTFTDAHSFSNTNEVRTKHLYLDISVNFEKKVVSGTVQHTIENNGADTIIFDTKNLLIHKVTLGKNQPKETGFRLGKHDELLGQALHVAISRNDTIVTIHYSTTDKTDAIDWLSPNLTAGKKYPFLYTQGEAILTRSWIPLQDTPANRITYSAKVTVPEELMAVMSATNPQEKSPDGVYHFEMNQSIPSYLIALAVGNIEFRALSNMSGIYAEPELIDKAAYEFADMPKMIEAAENLYGPYKWERYDVIVLPPAFPFGGMENPRLTFATPTILAGDRSLVSLIAHELAHSWSGNLVTNATWEDFWLNEGFTVYFESRIMEAIAGKEVSEMLTLIEYQELLRETEHIHQGEFPEDTHLKLSLKGRDPDDGMTAIAYTKGAFFLMTLEDLVGREKFDAFVKGYFESHEFQTLTTERFVSYLHDNLLKPNNITFNTDEWIYGPGIPANCRVVQSTRFDRVDELAKQFTQGKPAGQLDLRRKDWITQEWMNFIRQLPDTLAVSRMAELDEQFDFKGWGNAEIMSEWFVKSIQTGYTAIRPELRAFLLEVGRRKFLAPIYTALANSPNDREWGLAVFNEARGNYHAVSANSIDAIFN
jgi:aminopeptidase N